MEGIVGESTLVGRLRVEIQRAAASLAPVLIEGETGTGKELVALEIHNRSRRASGPFVVFRCLGLSEAILELELFGGSDEAPFVRRGLFEAARGGTLVLDAVEAFPPGLQTKLLGALQPSAVRPATPEAAAEHRPRLAAISGEPIRSRVERGEFRSDLFHRLDVLRIRVPPLRERPTDVPRLVRHFVEVYNRRAGTRFATPSRRALRALRRHSWPGNVRELENLIERVLLGSSGERIDEGAILQEVSPPPALTPEIVTATLRRTGGSVARAAELLGVSRSTIWRQARRCRPTVPDLLAE